MACWQHIRTYSCSACWLNIQLVALSATSSETQVNMDNTKLLRLSVTSIHTYLHKCDKTNSTQWALSYTYAFKYSYICILLNFPHVENGAVWYSNQFYRCKSVIPAFTCIWMILMIVCVCVRMHACMCTNMCVHACVLVCVQVCIHLFEDVCMSACVCVCMLWLTFYSAFHF